ncbi:hypothetical protein IW147_006265, partial [Coemansia sp. RSA 720]
RRVGVVGEAPRSDAFGCLYCGGYIACPPEIPGLGVLRKRRARMVQDIYLEKIRVFKAGNWLE